MSDYVPYIQAGAQIFHGITQKSAANFNGSVLDQEAKAISDQTGVAEQLQRRAGRESLGRSAAAFATAGVGPGSSSDVMDQAAINAELDALNTRYRGQFAKYGYSTQAQIERQQGSQAMGASLLNAGAAFLKSKSSGYTDG